MQYFTIWYNTRNITQKSKNVSPQANREWYVRFNLKEGLIEGKRSSINYIRLDGRRNDFLADAESHTKGYVKRGDMDRPTKICI